MTNKELKQLALRIKNKRKLLNYTQETFAEKVGIALSTYTKIENGFQSPSLNTLISISKNLNISIDFLLFGYENLNISKRDKDIISILERFNKDDIKNLILLLEKFL